MTMMIAVTMTHDPNIDTIVLQFAEMPAASAATSARLAALTSAARAALSNGDDNQISPAPPKRGIPQSDLEELPPDLEALHAAGQAHDFSGPRQGRRQDFADRAVDQRADQLGPGDALRLGDAVQGRGMALGEVDIRPLHTPLACACE
jgi:hypothetical protein